MYSSSNDGGVRVWTAEGQKITELPHCGTDVAALTISGTYIITGDEGGNVSNIPTYTNNGPRENYNTNLKINFKNK